MSILDEKIQSKIDELTDLAYEKKQERKTEDSFELLKKAWNLYPDPKENWNEAYNTAKYIYEDYLELQRYPEAMEWLNEMIKNDNNLHLSNEDCLFCIGKYLFCIQEYEDALNHFKEVVEESKKKKR